LLQFKKKGRFQQEAAFLFGCFFGLPRFGVGGVVALAAGSSYRVGGQLGIRFGAFTYLPVKFGGSRRGGPHLRIHIAAAGYQAQPGGQHQAAQNYTRSFHKIECKVGTEAYTVVRRLNG
jgi:hypothetical protein